MKRSFLLFLALLLAACTAPGVGSGKYMPIPTERPTVTTTPQPTPAPTATETPTAEPTKVVDQYPIDMDRLVAVPASDEDLVANLSKYVEAPDPLGDIGAFNEWWEKLKTTLGDQTKLEPNVSITSEIEINGTIQIMAKPEHQKALMGEAPFFYFEHEGKAYPVLMITLIDDRGYDYGTYALILEPGTDALARLASGEKIWDIILPTVQSADLADDVNRMVTVGLNGADSDSYYIIGPADIYTRQ